MNHTMAEVVVVVDVYLVVLFLLDLELNVLGDLILLRSACQFCICMYNLLLGWFYSR